MINSKRSLMERLHDNKDSLEFKTISSIYGKNIGEIRQVGSHVQTNAFTLLSKREEVGEFRYVDSWIYIYDKDISVNNNHIYYYKHNEKHTEENIEIDILIIEK